MRRICFTTVGIVVIGIIAAIYTTVASAQPINPAGDSAISQVSAQLGIPFPHTLRETLRRLREPQSEVPQALALPVAVDQLPVLELPVTQSHLDGLPRLLPDIPETADLTVSEAVPVKKETPQKTSHAYLTRNSDAYAVRQTGTLSPRVVPTSRKTETHEVIPASGDMLAEPVAGLPAMPETGLPNEIPRELPRELSDDLPAEQPVYISAETPEMTPEMTPETDPFPTVVPESYASVAQPPVVHEPPAAPEPKVIPTPQLEMPVTSVPPSPVADVLPPPELPTDTPIVTEIRGTGTPGPAAMEGTQTPRLTVEKTAPEEIQVGKPSTWAITVKNEGLKEARGVQIHDVVPKGTKLISSVPRAARSETGELTWNVGTMPAGTMAVVKVELLPVEEGTIGSVASVTFRSEASAKTVATRPQLNVKTDGDARILVGTPTELTITVTNPGSGVTRNVVLAETVPAELQFDGGAEILYKVGDLQPGETKRVTLPLTAVRPGKLTNKIVATADANLQADSSFEMEVTAPALEISMDGPARRFLEREGTYKLTVTNPGTAAAQNIEMRVALPPGAQFIRANNGGGFLADSRCVCWRLQELPAGDSASAEMVVSLHETGQLALSYEAGADICPVQRGEKNVHVEGIAALMFQVSDTNDPVQIGEDTSYEISVVNQGSRQAENVSVVVRIPAGMHLLGCKSPTQHSVQGNEIHFAALEQLAPKAEVLYELKMRGSQVGDQRVSVSVSSKEFPTPIVKEESTRVYAE